MCVGVAKCPEILFYSQGWLRRSPTFVILASNTNFMIMHAQSFAWNYCIYINSALSVCQITWGILFSPGLLPNMAFKGGPEKKHAYRVAQRSVHWCSLVMTWPASVQREANMHVSSLWHQDCFTHDPNTNQDRWKHVWIRRVVVQSSAKLTSLIRWTRNC